MEPMGANGIGTNDMGTNDMVTNDIGTNDMDSLGPYAWHYKNLRFLWPLCLALQKPTFP